MDSAGRTDEELSAELVERAREMVPLLRERARAVEENRRMADETHRAFVEAGFYRIFQPAEFGGYELDFGLIVALGSEIARGCGSSAWVFANLAGQGWINGMKVREAQQDVWAGNRDALIAAAFPGPDGAAREVDGGFLVDGTWMFSSGVDFADWNNLQLFIRGEEGPPKHWFALVPKSEYEIVDDWFPTGLAGTGSRALRLSETFIPAHRAIAAGDVAGGPTPGSAVNPNPIYKLPLFAIGNKQFSGVALGCARGALEVVEADLTQRRSVAGVKLSDQPTVQLRIGEASAEIEAARLLLDSDCRESMAVAAGDEPPSMEDRARWRRNNAYAGKLCVQAVERLFPLTGGRRLDFHNPYHRAARDVRAATSQGSMPWDTQAIHYGQFRLGQDLYDPRLFPGR